jgi:small-conductance mechanosensitive channel
MVWIDQPIQIPRIRSDLNYMIWNAFAENGIEIPFPQRDLHLRSGWQPLESQPKAENPAALDSP